MIQQALKNRDAGELPTVEEMRRHHVHLQKHVKLCRQGACEIVAAYEEEEKQLRGRVEKIVREQPSPSIDHHDGRDATTKPARYMRRTY
jgi:hypothetical protein